MSRLFLLYSVIIINHTQENAPSQALGNDVPVEPMIEQPQLPRIRLPDVELAAAAPALLPAGGRPAEYEREILPFAPERVEPAAPPPMPPQADGPSNGRNLIGEHSHTAPLIPPRNYGAQRSPDAAPAALLQRPFGAPRSQWLRRSSPFYWRHCLQCGERAVRTANGDYRFCDRCLPPRGAQPRRVAALGDFGHAPRLPNAVAAVAIPGVSPATDILAAAIRSTQRAIVEHADRRHSPAENGHQQNAALFYSRNLLASLLSIDREQRRLRAQHASQENPLPHRPAEVAGVAGGPQAAADGGTGGDAVAAAVYHPPAEPLPRRDGTSQPSAATAGLPGTNGEAASTIGPPVAVVIPKRRARRN